MLLYSCEECRPLFLSTFLTNSVSSSECMEVPIFHGHHPRFNHLDVTFKKSVFIRYDVSQLGNYWAHNGSQC